MPQLPDVSCLIKVIDAFGKRVSDGDVIYGIHGGSTVTATVRYVLFNDSNETAGPLFIVGTLFKDGVRIQPNGKSNVVPVHQITLHPHQIWTSEFTVTASVRPSGFVAKMLGDVGNFVNEEDETNNLAQISFGMTPHP